MNTRMKPVAAMVALGLTCAWTAQADESRCVNGKYNHADSVIKGVDDYKREVNASTSDAPTIQSFDYEVHNGMTKMSFRVKEGGTLKFKNKSSDLKLVITSDSTLRPPFDDDDNPDTDATKTVTVGARSEKGVRIDKRYVDGDCFTFSSRIGESKEEDPIVIIE